MSQMVKLAADAAPILMEKTALALQLLERIAPEFVPDVVADFQKISSVADRKTKEAAINVEGVKGGVGRLADNLAMGVVGGIGIAVASDLYNAARKGLTAGRNWKRMIEANPELRERSVEEVRTHFNTLQKTAPALASNPQAAGAAVQQLLDIPSNRYHQILTELAEDQKKIVDAQYKLTTFGGKK